MFKPKSKFLTYLCLNLKLTYFNPNKLYYSFTKVVVFAFIITSISSYFGYNTSGGALEVGKSSTKAVVYSSVLILLFGLILTNIFLNH